MKSFTTQILLMMAAVYFLMKGGVGILVAAWKLVLPLMFIGGAFYFMRKALSTSSLPKNAYDTQRVRQGQTKGGQAQAENDVIEICPHCLSEVGSCPECRKKKSKSFF